MSQSKQGTLGCQAGNPTPWAGGHRGAGSQDLVSGGMRWHGYVLLALLPLEECSDLVGITDY